MDAKVLAVQQQFCCKVPLVPPLKMCPTRKRKRLALLGHLVTLISPFFD